MKKNIAQIREQRFYPCQYGQYHGIHFVLKSGLTDCLAGHQQPHRQRLKTPVRRPEVKKAISRKVKQVGAKRARKLQDQNRQTEPDLLYWHTAPLGGPSSRSSSRSTPT